jgi:hypothetical protein
MATTLDVHETRRANLTKLLEHKGAKTQLAERLGTNSSHITHLLKPPTAASARLIREETARQIEEVMGLTPGTLDKPPTGRPDLTVTTSRGTVVMETKPPAAPERDARDFLFMQSAAFPPLFETALREVMDAMPGIGAEKTANMVRLVLENARLSGQVDRNFIEALGKLIK